MAFNREVNLGHTDDSSLFSVRPIIPYGKQQISDEDIQAVVETLRSDYLTQGPKIKEFEEAFAKYVGAKYAVACANGTAALHLCTMVLGVKHGDKVITTPITFAASANCVRYCGGDVVFTDIDPDTYLLDINEVKKLLENAPKGTIKGIIPVDFAGRAVDLEAYRALADEYGLWLIEDACHAPGGYFIDSKGQQQMCGNGNFADLAIFSFHPVKHIAAGEGGMVTTNDEKLYRKLLMLRTHGITREESSYVNSHKLAYGNSQETPITSTGQAMANGQWPGWYMEMQELGYNYRLTDFQAALGLSQLSRAEAGLERRRQIAHQYHEAFKSIPQITDRNFEAKPIANSQQPLPNTQYPSGHAFHLYVIEAKSRLGLYNHLRENGIFAQIHYIPCHLMPYYRQFGWKEGDLPNAEAYYSRCISLPMYPGLSEGDIKRVVDIITKNYEGS